jgi:hypothetical protein
MLIYRFRSCAEFYLGVGWESNRGFYSQCTTYHSVKTTVNEVGDSTTRFPVMTFRQSSSTNPSPSFRVCLAWIFDEILLTSHLLETNRET